MASSETAKIAGLLTPYRNEEIHAAARAAEAQARAAEAQAAAAAAAAAAKKQVKADKSAAGTL